MTYIEPGTIEGQLRIKALGLIVQQAGIMESILRGYVTAGLGGSHDAWTKTAGQSIRWLANEVDRIIADDTDGSLGDPAQVARFRKSVETCRAVNRKRNDMLHGAWSMDGELLVSRWGAANVEVRTVTNAELFTLASQIGAAGASLMAAARGTAFGY